jgi:ribosomal protein S18 acetylase RimI-like enzyme
MAVTLVLVDGDRESYVPLLLEADESEAVLRSYLEHGELFEIREDGVPVGAVLLIPEDEGELEIKNIAIAEGLRGRGLGRAAVDEVVASSRARGVARLVVGTADTSEDLHRFYRRCGFVDVGRREGFFDDYPEPVIERGRRAHDMMLFAMDLEVVSGDRGSGTS